MIGKKEEKALMKIVVLDGDALNPGDLSWNGFRQLGDVVIYERTPVNDKKMIIERIADATAVITNKTPIDREVLSAAPTIRYIGVLATGYNVIDIKAAKEKNVTVTNIPAYGTAAVAQFTMALLLEICNRVGHHNEAVKQGRWESSKDFTFWDFPLIELVGKTMGLIGFGNIGQATAKLAAAFGMNVLAYSPHPAVAGSKLAKYVELDELFAMSDVISLHCPLVEATAGMIHRETIAKMKEGVILLNTSRGALIDEEALAHALKSGKVYAAAVDVVSHEPITAENPLLTAENCLITPHIAWAPKESRQRLMDIAVNNLKAFQNGQKMNNIEI